MIDAFFKSFKNKKIIILGFGKEGFSTYKTLRKYLPEEIITIADKNENIKVEDFCNDRNVKLSLGVGYLDNLNDFDIIFKSPGISLNNIHYFIPREKITSQTDIFLNFFHNVTIGVTGTKGKSTTSSLIFHILKENRVNTFLAGNIGTPFFDIMDDLDEKSIVVAELSAHQLEFIHYSPHVAVLLNIYQEHLDHFNSFSDYQTAKINITHFQTAKDLLIFNLDDIYIDIQLKQYDYDRNYMSFSQKCMPKNGAYCKDGEITVYKHKQPEDILNIQQVNVLQGKHNYYNIMAAILVAKNFGFNNKDILFALNSFKPLPHRIEYVDTVQGVEFYNDSISTIPEASIAAVKTLKNVGTLILGGFDRGIDYSELISFIAQSDIANIVFVGNAGKRIYTEWTDSNLPVSQNILIEDNFTDIVRYCLANTQKKHSVLLSPAASSYDQFKNFEQRGDKFKQEILNLKQEIENNGKHDK